MSPWLGRGFIPGIALLLSSCSLRWEAIDFRAVEGARLGLALDRQRREDELDSVTRPRLREEDNEEELQPPGVGSVILGELIAIFPGFFVHGLGHYYAGDYETARRLRNIGQFGFLATALSGGALVGAYALDKNDQEGLAYSLYATGGIGGGIGLTYLMTAWFYDMIDTPRAVRTRGEPPPRSKFVESLDVFD